MDQKVQQALNATVQNWNTMAGSENDEAESAANKFEASFYSFIDAVREWVNGLEHRPQTLQELWDLPMIQNIMQVLPAPLHLNFETEAELIVENKIRIDDEKYD